MTLSASWAVEKLLLASWACNCQGGKEDQEGLERKTFLYTWN